MNFQKGRLLTVTVLCEHQFDATLVEPTGKELSDAIDQYNTSSRGKQFCFSESTDVSWDEVNKEKHNITVFFLRGDLTLSVLLYF